MANRSWKVGVSALAISAGLGFVSDAVRADELPSGGTVAAGSATIAGGAGSLSINQTTNRAIINWNSFSVGAGNSVTFNQPGSSSATLNRVTGSMGTTVAGTVSANGRLYLVNPNGIQITGSGVVRAAGFTASTLDIGDGDFLAGRNRFTGKGSSASVTNDGRIEISGGGAAVLIGGRVVNNGTISAAGGRVGLAAGEDVSVDVEGDGFLTVSAPSDDPDTAKALIEGAGRIIANGGRVEARVATSADLARSAIKLSGSIEARTVRAAKGGGVTFGSVTIDGGDGGSVSLGGTITATGGKGTKGGTVTVLGQQVALADASIDVSGDAGGGTIRIGGDKKGGGTLRRATSTTVSQGSTLKADAGTAGDGGSIVVWADDTTRFGGTISAQGGATGGNGGDAEVSGKAHLQLTADYESVALADLRAANGKAGTLLLDPGTVWILPSAGLHGGVLDGPDTFTDGFIISQLGSGNLTIDTNDATGANGTDGDIILKSGINGQAAQIIWSAATTLTLNAARHIVFEAGTEIENTTGGALVLNSGTAGSGVGTLLFAGPNQVDMGSGTVDITYNPTSNPQGSGINAASYVTQDDWSGFVTGALTSHMLVNTMFDLQNIRNNLGEKYALGRDIDNATDPQKVADFESLGGEAGNYQSLGSGFTGRFDGRGHSINTLNIDAAGLVGVGMFGKIGVGAIVENVSLTGVTVAGGSVVGALAGLNLGTIRAASSAGTVTATATTSGGLVGQNGDLGNLGTIETSSSSATFHGASETGGLVGVNYTSGSIADSFATGSVDGTEFVGGLVGYNQGSINRTYASGAVGGSTTGGLVGGVNQGSSGSNNYWDSGSTMQASGIGAAFMGSTVGVADAAGAPFDASTYAGFDPTVWAFADGERPSFNPPHGFTPAPAPDTTSEVIYVVQDDLSRQYGDRVRLEGETEGPQWTYTVKDKDGNVVNAADYLEGFDQDTTLARVGSMALPDANAGTRGVIYIAKGNLVAKDGYRIVFVNGSETVDQRQITVTADDKSKVQGSADPALTYLLTNGSLAFQTDALTGLPVRQTGEAAGDYQITQGSVTAGANYLINFVPGLFTIAPLPVAPTPPVDAPTTTAALDTITEPFIRTPTEIITSRIRGPQVSGSGVGGIFARGGGGTPGVSNIVTATIPGEEAAAAQEGSCVVELDETGAGTLRCAEATQ